MDRTCSVEGCDRPHRCKGYCAGHYRRFNEGVPVDQTPLRPRTPNFDRCTVPDCGRPHERHGLCALHAMRVARHGVIDFRRVPMNVLQVFGDTCTVTIFGVDGRQTVFEGDSADAELLRTHSWYESQGYAWTGIGGATVGMHRVVMGLDIKDSRVVDHRDGRPTNNRRANLRICTQGENTRNQRIFNNRGRSRHRNVGWDSARNLWVVKVLGVHVGRYSTEEEAAAIATQYRKDHGVPEH